MTKNRPGTPLFSEEKRLSMCLEAQQTSAPAVAAKYKTRTDNIYRWTVQLRKKGKMAPIPGKNEKTGSAPAVAGASIAAATTTTTKHFRRRAEDIKDEGEEIRRLHEVIGKLVVKLESLEQTIAKRSRKDEDEETEA